MWICTILVCIFIALLQKYVIDRRRRHRTFERQGIPGPKPSFIWGNFMQYRGSATKLMEWRKKHGKTFGYFQGEEPVLVTSDPEVIKNVCIKSFSSFHKRQFLAFFTPDDSLLHSEGKAWKRLRMILSPVFSASKMKEMSPLLNSCVDGLLEKFDMREKEGKAFNIREDYQALTMAAIASCGFGLEIDAIKDPENIFLQKGRAYFAVSTKKHPFFLAYLLGIGFLFPSLIPLMRSMMPNPYHDLTQWFYDTSAAIINSRKNKPIDRTDFIKLMFDAGKYEQCEENLEMKVMDKEPSNAPAENMKKQLISSSKDKGMTFKEMQGQCLGFFVAGYETNSTALSFLAYELALHPNIQEKLQQEVDEHFPDDEIPDYLSVQKMSYMDMVFSEVLRLYSIAGIIANRGCVEDESFNGIEIPKGAVVKIHMEGVHMDPEHWGPEDPSEFVPERFLPERKAKRNSFAWIPFGVGPRNCIGMRFALMEAKITMARVLKNFTICKTEETSVPLKIADIGITAPIEDIIVRLERRS